MEKLIDKISDVEDTIKKFSNLIKKVIRETSPQADQSDMDDIEQEIKIKIWKEFIKGEKKIYQPYSYIQRIAYTTTCRVMKKISKQKLFFAAQQEEYENLTKSNHFRSYGQQITFSEDEILEIVRNSISLLVESRRRVLKLYLLGIHSDEIADLLGWSKDKVRNLLYRGLDDLKEKLREEGLPLRISGG